MDAFISIWFQPRETVGDRSAREPWFLKLAIVWAWGAAYALERTMFEGKVPQLTFGLRLSLPILIGLGGGLFYFWTLSLAIELTNSWFKGRATVREIRRALILGAIPKAFSALFFVLLALVLRQEFFDGVDDWEDYPLRDGIVCILAGLAIVGLTVWGIIATSKTLAEVQGFRSAWKAWLHYIVAFICLGIVIAIPMLLWILMWKT